MGLLKEAIIFAALVVLLAAGITYLATSFPFEKDILNTSLQPVLPAPIKEPNVTFSGTFYYNEPLILDIDIGKYNMSTTIAGTKDILLGGQRISIQKGTHSVVIEDYLGSIHLRDRGKLSLQLNGQIDSLTLDDFSISKRQNLKLDVPVKYFLIENSVLSSMTIPLESGEMNLPGRQNPLLFERGSIILSGYNGRVEINPAIHQIFLDGRASKVSVNSTIGNILISYDISA